MSRGNRKTFLLLHGFPQGKQSFTWLRRELEAAGHTVIQPELPGYIANQRVKSRFAYRFSAIAKDLIRGSLKDVDEYIVVGHDLGATIATILAKFDDRCSGLVTISAPHPAAFILACFSSGQALRSWYFLPAQSLLVSNCLFNPAKPKSRKRLSNMLLSNGMNQTQVNQTMKSVFDTVGLSGPLRWYQGMPFESPRLIWSRVKVPWIQIGGAKDRLCTNRSFDLSRRWANNTFSHIQVPDMTHWLDEKSSKTIVSNILDAQHRIVRK